jgi:hypothetical protein
MSLRYSFLFFSGPTAKVDDDLVSLGGDREPFLVEDPEAGTYSLPLPELGPVPAPP